MATPAWIAAAGEGVRIRARVTPRAARDELIPGDGPWLGARVSAAPAEGRANVALCRLLAKELRVGRTRVELVRGARSREKVVQVGGISVALALERLNRRA